MIVKVCGMRDARNIRELDEAGIADWMGFIFFARSSRNVSALPDYLPKHCKRVGVFVNESTERIAELTQAFGFNLIQLHGHEDARYIKALKQMIGNDIKIIKMIQIETEEDLACTRLYEGLVNYFLFETKCQSYGGSGMKFDWTLLQSYAGQTPFLLTGGIGPDDADKVNVLHHPMFAGIDLNSKFETSPALKDIDSIKKFTELIK